MDLDVFLKKLVEQKPIFKPSFEEEKAIKLEGIVKFIVKKLNSSSYKASAITPDYLVKVKDKINLCVNHEVPIHFTVPFGAVKVPTLPTAPGIDWGEVFAIIFLRDYLAPIAKMYKHGVILDYISVAVFEEKMNYFPHKDVILYDREFEKLIKIFKNHFPENLSLNFKRVTDHLPKEPMLKMIDKKVVELKRNWMQNSEEVRNTKIMRAKRNCCLDAKDKDYDKKILDSIFVHDAFCSECWTLDSAPWDKKDMITLGYRYTDGWAIHIRSARGSTVNFWSGMGALLKRDKDIIPTILSLKQYKDLENNIRLQKVKVFDEEFKNLNKIPVVS